MARKPSVPHSREPAERRENDRSRNAGPETESRARQIEQILEGLAEANNGQFVPEKEMRRLWRRFGA